MEEYYTIYIKKAAIFILSFLSVYFISFFGDFNLPKSITLNDSALESGEGTVQNKEIGSAGIIPYRLLEKEEIPWLG